MTTATALPADHLLRTIDAACDRVAPTWPLDRFIAVNPYWGWREMPIGDAAAALGALAGTRLTMPRSWFREEWAAGRLDDRHLGEAAAALGHPLLEDAARRVLRSNQEQPDPPVTRMPLVTDLVDGSALPGPVPGRTWTDLVAHQIGQHCAARFDEWQATWAPDRERSLFGSWCAEPAVSHGFRWVHGSGWARHRLASLPADPVAAIALMLDDLGIPHDARESYLTAVLGSVNGWAAWCAYRRFQARLVGGDDAVIVDLLAIRMAWEWLLAADASTDDELAAHLADWAVSWRWVQDVSGSNLAAQRVDWVLQGALERTYQDRLLGGFRTAAPTTTEPDVQAVFCIDVRSEVLRRALEAVAPSVATRGFAGFFGLPIAYSPAGAALTRPQLPGLLSPSLEVTDASDDPHVAATVAARPAALAEAQRWDAFRRQPSSVFTFVETLGLTYGAKLVQYSAPHRDRPAGWEHEGIDGAASIRPRLALLDEDPAAAAALAQRVLTGMGLVRDFAPLVMVCGHGSQTANNPHAAGLDCGACGGQTGEVNARVLAGLLNDPRVREGLRAAGIDVPHTTWFVAALHTTTTDAVTLFDTDLVPSSHATRVDQLSAWLAVAGDRARAERAPALGLGHLVGAPDRLAAAVQERANDWSQVRPEWGLAGNAAFVVAPRWRTRGMDLEGRSFLHDYDWRLDRDGAVLTLILTAPMVVTNWINLQYHASTVDNRRYGSGDKVLHNVVGGNLGVFEGNGGDLRIGLPMQSLHDGETLRHRPLRLSVFVESPREAIDAVIEQHAVVRDLALNGWLHLLRIEPSDGSVEERTPDGWRPRHEG